MKKEVNIGVFSDKGDVKQTNQDSVLCKFKKIKKNNVGLFIVADGMGGLSYGEEISNLVTTYFNRWWNETLLPLVVNRKLSDDKINLILENAIAEINKSAVDFSKQVEKKAGSTLSLLLIIGYKYYIKNVGDSRVYIIRNNKKNQLTQDQSLVAQMVRNNEITEEQAKNYGKKNVLTMCLGVFENIKTNSTKGKVKSGDIFIVCCDGFYNFVLENEIIPTIKEKTVKDYPQKVTMLRNKIPVGNAKDNVSIILVGFLESYKAFKVTGFCMGILGTILLVSYLYNNLFAEYVLKIVRLIWK